MTRFLGMSVAVVGAATWFAIAAPAIAEDKPLTIGVSHQSLGFPYAVALENGELKAAKEAGVKTIDLDSHLNTLTQANDIDKLIAQHVDGIVMDPGDSIAAQDWADKAKAAGIPIASRHVGVRCDHGKARMPRRRCTMQRRRAGKWFRCNRPI